MLADETDESKPIEAILSIVFAYTRSEANEKAVADATAHLHGSRCWTRTSDPLINSQLLYQLS
jgi:hypothetical protein